MSERVAHTQLREGSLDLHGLRTPGGYTPALGVPPKRNAGVSSCTSLRFMVGVHQLFCIVNYLEFSTFWGKSL